MLNINITSYSQLEHEINKRIREGLRNIGDKGEKIVKEQIQKDVYAGYFPSQYERTFGLMNSITYKLEGNVLTIYHEGMSGYTSVVKGYTAKSELIPKLIHDYGAKNIFGGKGGAWTKPRKYMDNAINDVEKLANSVFGQLF